MSTMDGYTDLDAPTTTWIEPAPRLLTSRYHTTCAACQGHIRPGQRIAWAPGTKPRHSICPITEPSTNAAPATCERCGWPLAPGQGLRYACEPGHDHHRFRPDLVSTSGTHLDCRDSELCRLQQQKPLATRHSPGPAENDA